MIATLPIKTMYPLKENLTTHADIPYGGKYRFIFILQKSKLKRRNSSSFQFAFFFEFQRISVHPLVSIYLCYLK